MPFKKSTRSTSSSAPLVVDKPDADLIAKNKRLKQSTVCSSTSNEEQIVSTTVRQRVSVTESHQTRPQPGVPPTGRQFSSQAFPPPEAATFSNEDIQKLIKKISTLEKGVARIEHSLIVSRVKDNTPISAQSTDKNLPDIQPAKVFSLAPNALRDILCANRDNEDANEKLGLEDFGEYKSQRRILLNLWIRNLFNVYLYESKLANFTDKAVNESRVHQVIDKIADAMFTCLDKMDIQNTSYEVIRANFRNKVRFLNKPFLI
jgi:hypothetical protein